MKGCKLFILIFVLLLIANTLNAQSTEVLNSTYKWFGDQKQITVPFKLVRNLIVIPIEINNVKFDIALDTGFPNPGININNNKKATETNFKYTGEMDVVGANGATLTAKTASGVKFKIDNIEFSNQEVTVMPENPNLALFPFDGAIGNEILSRFIVDINYGTKLLTILEPSAYIKKEGAKEIKINFVDNFPTVTGSVTMESGAVIPVNMVLDLGAGHTLALILGSQKEIVLPKNNIKTILGRGATGEVFGYKGRIKNFTFNGFSFDNVLVSFNENRRFAFEKDGNLGSVIMQRFDLTLDFPGKRIFLKPNTFFRDPFEFNMAGLILARTPQGTAKISQIIENSEGEKAGLKTGDIILKVNNKEAGQIDATEFNKLFEEENQVVELVIKRGETTKTISVKLRRII